MISLTKRYVVSIGIALSFMTSFIVSAEEAYEINVIDAFPQDDLKLYVYEDNASCENMENRYQWYPFSTYISLNEEKIRLVLGQKCFGKIVKEADGKKEIIKNCVPGVVNKETNTIAFNFKSDFNLNSFGEKRYVIAIANSISLRSNEKGKKLQEALLKWLTFLKENNTDLPIDVITINEDGSVTPVIKAEELRILPNEGRDNSILARIQNRITFAGKTIGTESLTNLNYIDDHYKNEQNKQNKYERNIKKILYITHTEETLNPLDLSGPQVGTLYLWKMRGIELTVISDSWCELWKGRDIGIDCKLLSQNPDEKKLIEGFNKFVGLLRVDSIP